MCVLFCKCATKDDKMLEYIVKTDVFMGHQKKKERETLGIMIMLAVLGTANLLSLQAQICDGYSWTFFQR